MIVSQEVTEAMKLQDLYYLNSSESAQTAQVDFSGKVEFSKDKEKIVDF